MQTHHIHNHSLPPPEHQCRLITSITTPYLHDTYVTYDHISSLSTYLLLYDDLVSQRQHGGKIDYPAEVSNPSHHLIIIWHSLGSRCRPRPGEGTTDCQEPAWGAEVDNKRALLGTEEELSSDINNWSSIRHDNSLWGELRPILL